MKTSLKSQVELVKQIKDEPILPVAVKLLRTWLEVNGYEGSGKCMHYAIMRNTGKCLNCQEQVTEPLDLF